MCKKSSSAQGTIEYLLIVGVVVVVSLVVVGLLTGFLSQGSQVNSISSRAYWQSQSLAIIDSVQDNNGKLLIVVRNNSSENLTLGSVVVNGAIYDVEDILLASQSSKSIYLNKSNSDLQSGNAEISFNYISESGLAKTQVGSTPLLTTIVPAITASENVSKLVEEDCFDWNGLLLVHPVCSCDDLNKIDYNSTTLTWNYSLQNNINFTNCDSSYTTGSGWKPIGDNSTGTTATRFSGTFKGNDYTIKNLYIYRPDSNYVGLFGYVSAATKDINDIGMVDSNINGFWYVGGITGYQGKINNSYNTGAIRGGRYVGGLSGGYAAVNNSYNSGTVIGSSYYTGGINGAYGAVNNSYNTGVITGTTYVAGITAYYGTINKSYNTGTITGGNSVGGINAGFGTTTNSYNTGTVYASLHAGGVNAYGGSVRNSYNTGTIRSTGIYAGGISGREVTITNSYNAGYVRGTTYVGGILGSGNSVLVTNSFSTGTVIGTADVNGAIGSKGSGSWINLYWHDSNSFDNGVTCNPLGDLNCTRLTDLNYSLLYNSSTPIFTTNPAWDANWVWSGSAYPRLAWE
jgi:hypothetical protein